MTFPKILIDNSVGYVNKEDHSHSEQPPLFSEKRKKVLPIINFHRIKKNSIKT